MELKIISYVPAIVGVLIVGTFVLLTSRSIRNKLFAFGNLVVALWLGLLFMADIISSPVGALWLLRSALFFGSFAFLLFYYFTLTFPYMSKLNYFRQALYSLPLIIVAIISFTPWVLPAVNIQPYGADLAHTGSLYYFSDGISIVYLLIGVALLLQKYKYSNLQQKKQIKFVLLGIIFALVVNILTGDVLIALNVNTDYIYFGGFSLFIFSLFVGYAIMRHGFFSIRLIVARSVAYILSLGILVTAFVALTYFIGDVLLRASDSDRQLVRAVNAFFAVLLALAFPYFKRFFDKYTNRLFYRDAYDPQAFIDQLNRALVVNLDLENLLTGASEVIVSNLKAEWCVFGVRETEFRDIRVIGTTAKNFGARDIKAVRQITPKLKSGVIVTDDLPEEQGKLKRLLADNDIALLARLAPSGHSDEEGLGYIILGAKKSGNPYSAADEHIIEIIAKELLIATQNALHFEEIQHFNETLQLKVENATREVKRANERLKQLDETKDDFISMASHQLRTPLTSVKGYISLILDGDVGRINAQQRKMLGQAFTSSQRMVYLIADLLNVSRLKTGKFAIEAAPLDLAGIITEEMDQLVAAATAKDLQLTYDPPKDFPALMLDETKTRQVIMNFIDNAIYYTPAGGKIEIRLAQTPVAAEFRVVDNGIGVPASERHHLFTKFYRAKNAQKARPDGTGLGLFMAKKVVVAEGGSIIFDSEENKGSTFGFSFPLAKLAVKPAKAPAPSVAAKKPAKELIKA